MTAVLVFLKMAGSFIKDHWQLAAALAVVLALVVSFTGWSHARERAATAEHALKAQLEQTLAWRTVARHQSDKALEAARLQAEFEAKLAAALAEPPEVVHVYHDAVPGVAPVVDQAADCEAAVSDLARYLQEVVGGAP